MTFVITDLCRDVCDTECVNACPVEAIWGPKTVEELREVAPEARGEAFPGVQMFIDPEACICCSACAPVCPAEAIFHLDEVPEERHASIAENAAFFAV